MWALKHVRTAGQAIAEASTTAIRSPSGRLCRRCLNNSSLRPAVIPTSRFPSQASTSRQLRRRWNSSGPSLAHVFVSATEEAQAKLLESAGKKVVEYHRAANDVREDMTIEEQKDRARLLKEMGPLAQAWDSYQNLRKAILETQTHLDDPDPVMQEMFKSEHEELLSELDNLVTVILPQLILPPLPAASLPAIMTLTAGIGGGESARFLEEMSKMYTRYAENKGWKVQIISASEGAMAKGSGGNGYREMTIKFLPAEFAEEGAECFGEIMWEKGTHRVQRVPPGSTVDKLQSSTVNANVSPIYADTEEEPLVNPKDVREDVMRARGAGGQHVNKTESAIRLVHEPTGITVSMQDSRSQAANRVSAWEVLRARLSEKKRLEEQERRNANRLSAIKASFRGDKVRTYNYPQDRVTDHRIGFSSNGLTDILSGEGFGVMVEAMKKDFAERRLEALLQGEEDLIE